MLEEGQAQVIEVPVPAGYPPTPLRTMGGLHGAIVGAVLRDDAVVVPGGDEAIRGGDRLLVVTTGPDAEALRRQFSPPVVDLIPWSWPASPSSSASSCDGSDWRCWCRPASRCSTRTARRSSRSSSAPRRAPASACCSAGSANRRSDLRRPDALAVVAFTYLVIALAGALPYMLVGLSPIDALFESMSGLTTTGGTALADFSLYGRGIHFWRALSHWLGGIGVITLFVAVLPKLAIGGRDLFFAEASGPTDEALTPQIRKTAAALGRVYLALTAAAVVALLVAGLSRVRRDRPRLRHGRGRRLLAAPAVGDGVSAARRGMDAHVLHVPGRRQLRPPLPGHRSPDRRGSSATRSSSPTPASWCWQAPR